MKKLDVEGLPDHMVQVLQSMVDAVREQLDEKPADGEQPGLPAPPGKVIGGLRREDIYDHLG